MRRWTCVLSILLLHSSTHQFAYKDIQPFSPTDCNVCFGNDCFVLDPNRCAYYALIRPLLRSIDEVPTELVDDPDLKAEVDVLIFDMVDKASDMKDIDCIPYISRYTNCNKENVCVGCTSCSCNDHGKWNCSAADLCHVGRATFNVDREILLRVFRNLMVDDPALYEQAVSNKKKRSVTETPQQDINKIIYDPMTMQQISDWFYGDNPPDSNDANNTEANNTTLKVMNATLAATYENATTPKPLLLTTTKTREVKEPTSEADYVAFDDVLRNIAVDTKNNTRRKPLLPIKPNNITYDIDYMLLGDEEDNTDYNKTLATDNAVKDIKRFIEGKDIIMMTERNFDGDTNIIIDLLDTVPQNDLKLNSTDPSHTDIVNNQVGIGFDDMNDLAGFNVINIMKRDVVDITNTTEKNNSTSSYTITETSTPVNQTCTHINSTILRNSIILPLNQIIGELKTTKDNLLKYILSVVDYFSNYTSPTNSIQWSQENDLRRDRSNLFNKFAIKLKRDIIEVLRDVVQIQKIKKSKLPNDLKFLIRAMKIYTSKNNLVQKDGVNKILPIRRNSDTDCCSFISLKDCFVLILQTLVRKAPTFNVLGMLSLETRKILKDFIQTHYVDDSTQDAKHVIANNDISNISNRWLDMISTVVAPKPSDTLYRMKLLHYVLITDISKMENIKKLVNLAATRRTAVKIRNVNETTIDNLNSVLEVMRSKLLNLLQENYLDQYKVDDIKFIKKKNHKKHSSIKHIQKLLKNSKRDIDELLHGRIPNSELVQYMARRKLDALTQQRYNEYEGKMKKWQKNLDITSRRKRSLLDKLSGRMKSIIPKYLRHKVNPQINSKKRNATITKLIPNPSKKSSKKKRSRGRQNSQKTTSVLTTRKIPVETTTKATKNKKKQRSSKKISHTKKPHS